MHHAEFGPGREVSIETPSEHLVETLRSVDVGDRNDHDFELHVHEIPLVVLRVRTPQASPFCQRTFPFHGRRRRLSNSLPANCESGRRRRRPSPNRGGNALSRTARTSPRIQVETSQEETWSGRSARIVRPAPVITNPLQSSSTQPFNPAAFGSAPMNRKKCRREYLRVFSH